MNFKIGASKRIKGNVETHTYFISPYKLSCGTSQIQKQRDESSVF
ncbi:MAG TPA: hypothetical protein VI933_00840 [archaeon]|nr:hypothetical protein [archaeon]